MSDLEKVINQFKVDYPGKHILLQYRVSDKEEYVLQSIRTYDDKNNTIERKEERYFTRDNLSKFNQLKGRLNSDYDNYRSSGEEWYNPCPS